MPNRKYSCKSCGTKHHPPTGDNCPYVLSEQEEEVFINQDKSVDVVKAVENLTETVGTLVADVATLKSGAMGSSPSISPPARQSSPPQWPTHDQAYARRPVPTDVSATPAVMSSAIPEVTLQQLPAVPELAHRADALLSSGPDVATDLVNLHYLTGGKLLKSPRDAPVRRIVRTVLWPNQFVTRLVGSQGVVKFDDLTLPEFSLGSLKIIQLPEVSSAEKTSRIRHLEWIMNFARFYAWPTIRAMYAVVLEDVQYGAANWGDSIQQYKESHMLASNLLHGQDIPHRDSSKSTRLQASDYTPQPCRKYNFELCQRSPCPYRHVYINCLRGHGETAQHPNKDCPRRHVRTNVDTILSTAAARP